MISHKMYMSVQNPSILVIIIDVSNHKETLSDINVSASFHANAY